MFFFSPEKQFFYKKIHNLGNQKLKVKTLKNSNIILTKKKSITIGEILQTLNISRPRVIFVSRRTSTLIHRVSLTLPWKMQLIQLDDESPIEKIVTLGGMISQKRQWPDAHRYQAQVVTELSAKEIVILCSSGTTGLPKGVMLSHRNLMAALRCFR